MSLNRSSRRNIYIHDATKPDDGPLGGLVQNGSITEANFIQMLHIILVTSAPIRVQHRSSGNIISESENKLELGTYDIYCDEVIQVSNQLWIKRIFSQSVSGRVNAFRHGVRARDQKCVISGVMNLNAPERWTSFEAAHIFPLEKEDYWIRENYGRWITDMDNTIGLSKINSIQNGLLLQSSIHQLFDSYLLSVNPDDNYKVIVFDTDLFGVDGRSLDPVCLDPENPHRVSDELLRWHFRQSVLANMRGAGEPVFEHDFVDGDMIQEISEGPYGKERLEMELEARLHGFEGMM